MKCCLILRAANRRATARDSKRDYNKQKTNGWPKEWLREKPKWQRLCFLAECLWIRLCCSQG